MAGNIQYMQQGMDQNPSQIGMGNETEPLLGSRARQRRSVDTDMRQNHSVSFLVEDSKQEENPANIHPHVHFLTRSLSTANIEDLSSDSFSSRPNITTSHSQRSSPRILGTFSGVFAPVAMSMFSTLLYLRAGFVVGQAGLLGSYSQLVLAYFILFMTVLSICAISTNGALEGGGAYYMISRALGPEFGGSIGFLFFVANILSCALYTTGFVEGFLENFGKGGSFMSDDEGLSTNSDWWQYAYCTIALFVCGLICIVGGAMFARTSAIILLVVVFCTITVIISFFVKSNRIDVDIPKTNDIAWANKTGNISDPTAVYTGLSGKTFRDNIDSNYTIDYSTDTTMSYATVFAILFSSVTGILNGANMSGELKDPSKSIPKGTVSAVFFTFCTYLIMMTLIAGSCSRDLLINNYAFLQQINVWDPFVVIGMFAASISAALGNLIGASRVLQALGNDQLFWHFLKPATITTNGGNPILSVVISWFLVQLVLLVGSLNKIAPITSVFFLLSYASTNLACLALELASAPNFRPTFTYFSWHTCMLGLLGCMIMCFLISAIYTSVALVLMLLLVILLHFRSLPTTWGSISQALIFHQVRKYLLMLDPGKSHVKYWRPQILLMVANPRQSCELMDFCNDIKKSGLYVIGHVKTGKLESAVYDPCLEETPVWLKLIQQLRIKAFIEMTLAATVPEGFQHLVRISGLGGMKVNTVCFGFYDDNMPQDSLLKRKTHRQRRLFGSTERREDSTSGNVLETFDSPRTDPGKRVSQYEYVKLIKDALKLQKNVFLCRNFQLLDKEAILKPGNKSYIDVWPVNFFKPETASYFDKTCLFMLQLACILTMQNGWKNHTELRVYLCVKSWSENTDIKEKKLSTFLRQLRIQAKIKVVCWDSAMAALGTKSSADEPSHVEPVLDLNAEGGHSMNEFASKPDSYLRAINTMLQDNSSHAAVTFMYLPQPPTELDDQASYVQQLTKVSDWPQPTVFVHGLHPVTSTTL
ncbi:solute carrier family 12 member 9 [Plakobranchus ocellatus]|uniref:Solute carrier family 12 member 9 n=1 Tax=Plakobranchus ocellatus TaxID=259542 RepID=A0AAV3YR78_9GAST|nr:solute carrier family 12 member 9 [Plakobranchus ocellatus]